MKGKENLVFVVHDVVGINLLTQLRLGFSHLNERQFRQNVKDAIKPVGSCSTEIESTKKVLYKRK